MKHIDVLNLEWNSSLSRDRVMATLVCNYLRLQGLEVIESSLFDAERLLWKYRPKLVLLTNTTGAPENVYMAKLIKEEYGIPIVSLVSEGNFRDIDTLDIFVWGWNNEKILYEDCTLYWSKRAKDLTVSRFPELSDRIRISGSVGLDRYIISSFVSKHTFLSKYKKERFSTVIGIGCWDFGPVYEDDHRYKYSLKCFGEAGLERLRKDHMEFNTIVIEAIKKNPSVLFLLKEHPGVLKGHWASGILGANSFDNVIIVKNEETILDCISVCDLWCVFDSTTALEAWLLNKPTCLINPSGPDFYRDGLYKGSPAIGSYKEFEKIITKTITREVASEFLEKEHERFVAQKEVSEWIDGFNHVRAGNVIIEHLRTCKNSYVSKNLKWYFRLIIRLAKRIARKIVYGNKLIPAFYQKDVIRNSNMLLKEQVIFYQKRNKSMASLSEIKCI